jgi:asparagine synthase (glutamine-hydrolysing)
MPSRFLALTTQHHETHQRVESVQRLLGMPKIFGSKRLTVFSDQPAIALADHGVVLGAIFSKTTLQRQRRFSSPEAQAVLSSRGAALVERYWGGYVALLDASETGEPCCVRDPTGGLSCFYSQSDGDIFVASDAVTLVSALGRPIDIDWHRVHAHLLDPAPDRHRTALANILELPPGERLVLGQRAKRDEIWSPWTFARAISDRNFNDVVTDLHDTASACACAWSSDFDQISLGVSGGLDSSVVATSLAFAGQPPICFTMVSDDPEGDERFYARILTDFLGVALHEHRYRVEDIDVRTTGAAFLPRPALTYVPQALHKARRALQSEFGIKAHFSGGGGDNIFCLTHSAAPLVDKFEQHGPSLDLWRVVRDISRLTSASAFDIVAHALRHRRARRGYRPDLMKNRFLHDDGEAVTPAPHPWLDAPAETPPGKARHVGMLALAEMGAQGDPNLDTPPFIQPLLSQPLIELCLKIPSWVWATDGINRAPVRSAFARQLPPTIVQRTSKGGPTAFSRQIYRANRATLMEMLLDGAVAKNLPVDRTALEATLRSGAPASRLDMRSILNLGCAEAWSMAWRERSVSGRFRLAV